MVTHFFPPNEEFRYIIKQKMRKQPKPPKNQPQPSPPPPPPPQPQTYLISKPPRIMTPLQHFRYEKQAQKTAKKKIDKSLLLKLKSINVQWQELSTENKSYYYQFYKKRKQELDLIKFYFRILTENHFYGNPYLCYYRQRYPILAQAYPERDGKFLTKVIAENWKKLSALSKIQFENQAKEEAEKVKQRSQNKKQLINQYQYKVSLLKKQIQTQKQKIIDKYSFKKRPKTNIKSLEQQEKLSIKQKQRPEKQKQKQKEKEKQKQKQKQDKKETYKKQVKQLKSEITKVFEFKIDNSNKMQRNKRKDEIKPYNPTQPARKQLETKVQKRNHRSQEESEQSSQEKQQKVSKIQTRTIRVSKKDRKKEIKAQKMEEKIEKSSRVTRQSLSKSKPKNN